MIEVSNAFKEAARAPVKVIRASIVCENDTYTSSDVLVSLSKEDVGFYFSTTTKSLSFKLLGTDYDLVGKNVTVTYEIQSSNSWDSCILGRFTIYEQTANLEKGTTEFKAYDPIGMMGRVNYDAGSLNFPCTVENLFEQICNRFGLTRYATSVANLSYQIREDLYAKINGTTFRDILAEIAGATASVAEVNNETIRLRPIEMVSTETLTYANLKKAKLEPKYGPINTVILARTPAEDNIIVTDDEAIHEPIGKNLFDKGRSQFSGYFERNGTDAGTIKSFTPNYHQNTIIFAKCQSGKTYTFHTTMDSYDHIQQILYGFSEEKPAIGVVLSNTGSLPKNNNGGQITAPFDGYLTIRIQTQGDNDEKIAAYEEAINTAQIERGSIPTEYEPFKEQGMISIKLSNNEILDDDRETLAQPILDAVDGFYFYPFEITTEGHGWYEIGDRLTITDGTNSWEIIVSNISLSIGNGIKEVIKGVAPSETQTNYALAGGITKTIYNTEIKVDKQGQEIISVVSRQDQFENQTLENFSQVTQNINSITTTIQTTGGGNLIHNSVGYNIDSDRNLVNWTKTGTISSESSPESVSYGAISGNQINLFASSSITQRIIVDGSGNQLYTFSLRAKKSATGIATIHLMNNMDDYTITIPEGEAVLWNSYSLVGIEPHSTYFDVVIQTNSAVTEFSVTDLMMTVGDSTTPWVSASDEILSKNVAVDSSGVTVRSNTTNDYVQLNELGLNGFSDASGSMENVFTVNRDTTEVSKLKTRNQISMSPIKIVPIKSGTRAGWAFVKES